MKLTIERFTVAKRFALTISRGTSTGSENLLVSIEHNGLTGIGEMAPTSGGAIAETAEMAEEALERWRPAIEQATPYEWQRINEEICATDSLRVNPAARAALNMAVWDWIGKSAGQPVYRLLGLDLNKIVHTSVTVGINPPEVVRQRTTVILLNTGTRRLKIKLGSQGGIEMDKQIVLAAIAASDALAVQLGYAPSLRVDANGGWNVAQTLDMAEWLAERGIEYIEQPIVRGMEALYAELAGRSALPIYSDESIGIAADIPPLAPYIAGINIKLMKCGGISEALNMIATAKAHGLRVMFGCMSETSLSISAAAHISPLADELDLDSHLNLNPDPFAGALWQDGRVVPTEAPGLGVNRL